MAKSTVFYVVDLEKHVKIRKKQLSNYITKKQLKNLNKRNLKCNFNLLLFVKF